MWGDGEVTRRKSRAKSLAQGGKQPSVLLLLNEEQVSTWAILQITRKIVVATLTDRRAVILHMRD